MSAAQNDQVRNATLQDMVTILKDQNFRKHDIVVPASKVRARNGRIVVKGAEQEITEEGVTSVDGSYLPTAHFDTQIGTKLGIAPAYLAKCRAEAVDLYDANVNGWLAGRSKRAANGDVEVLRQADDRSFLIRAFSDGDGTGVARALLSDRFNIIDNLDVLTACLEAIKKSGVEVDIRSCDLSPTRMYVDLHAPSIEALAPELLRGYRNPFADPAVDAQRRHGSDVERWREIAQREGQGYEPGTEPVVFAGFRISNCEVGGGAFTITPRLHVRICRNGLVIPAMQVRNVHLGSKLEEGVIKWSDETRRKELEVIKAKTVDAVQTFLSPEFLNSEINKIEEKAGKSVSKPVETVKVLAKTLNFTQDEQDGILDHFIRSGQPTAGGLVNSITSFSQTIGDADRADQLDAQALRVLSLV